MMREVGVHDDDKGAGAELQAVDIGRTVNDQLWHHDDFQQLVDPPQT